MIAQVHSATLIGIEALPIVVEMDLQGRIDGDGERYFILVGLPDKAVQESKERVRTAVRNSGLKPPYRRSASSAFLTLYVLRNTSVG